MKQSLYTVRTATPYDDRYIIETLNDYVSFGLGTPDMIATYTWYILERKGQAIGVASVQVIKDLYTFLLAHDELVEHITTYFEGSQLQTIGHLVVEEEFQHTRAAYRLCEGLFKRLKGDFIVIGWKAQSIALKFGFQILTEVKQFWHDDSLLNHYGCPYCKIGCTCNAIVAVKRSI